MPAISVFTPAHDSKWLDDVYNSLIWQEFEDWEWVVLLNNGAEYTPPKDARVKVNKYSGETKSVGQLKGIAIQFCRGDVLVEMDADDILLSPKLLGNIHQALTGDEEVTLVYSDFTQLNEDLSPNLERFRADHGWAYQMVKSSSPSALDAEYLVPKLLAPTPHNVAYIWYAPNHVRAFPRWAYEQVGGYSNLEVCDDLELMNKLYQSGPFYKVDGLYGQRIHDGNTQKDLETNALIQVLTKELYEQNIAGNLLAWCKRNGLRALELGGGNSPTPGFESVDKYAPCDIKHTFPARLDKVKDGSVGVIRAVDFLEHIEDKSRMMDEIWRMLAPNGMLLSLTPSTDGRGAFQDPTHVSYWNENSFWYVTDENMAHHSRQNKRNAATFQISSLKSYYPSEWHQEHNIVYVQANLIAVKEGYLREGGLINVGFTDIEERFTDQA